MSDNALSGDYLPARPQIELNVDKDEVHSEDILDFTQNIRKQMVRNLVARGLPDQKEDTELLLTTMRDMDRVALGRMKIQTDKEGNANGRLAQEIVDRLFKLNPHGLASDTPVRTDIPVPDIDELPQVEFAPDMLVCGLVSDTADEFVKRYENE